MFDGLFVFPNFRKMGEFAVSIEHSEAKSVSASGGRSPPEAETLFALWCRIFMSRIFMPRSMFTRVSASGVSASVSALPLDPAGDSAPSPSNLWKKLYGF